MQAIRNPHLLEVAKPRIKRHQQIISLRGSINPGLGNQPAFRRTLDDGVGKKARAPFARTHKDLIVGTVDMTHIKNVGFADAKSVADEVVARFEAGEFDVAHLFFSTFKSALTQEPTRLQIIPAALPAGGAAGADASVEYEPDEESILADLLPKNLAVQVFRALLENAASEQGSRMTAMDSATRNAGDMINKLSITYNRTRQAAITKELIEIISGAEAL